MTTSQTDIARATLDAGFSALRAPTAVAIAIAESDGDESKQSATGRGLWQLNPSDVGTDWADAKANARAAKKVADRPAGFQYWSAYRSNRYMARLPEGAAAVARATALDAPGKLLPDLPDIPNPLSGITDAVVRPLRVLTDRDLWIRGGMAFLGVLVLVLGTVGLIWSLGAAPVLKKATKIVGA